MPRRLALAVALMATFAFVFPAITAANHSWGNYHWARQSNPFTLKLGDNVNATWDPILATTSSDWTASSVLNTTIVTGASKGKNCRATSGRVEVCNGSYGNNGWLGVAQIWASGSHITQGTVKVNDTYFNTAPYNTTAWRNLVMCQEVGHTFGLDHQDEIFDNPNLNTCMDYTNNPTSNQHPNAHDYAQLEAIYSHLDSTTTVGQTVSGSSASGWGRLVAVTNGGRTSVFVAGAGDQVVISFVIWAN
jgi:hypothetical protein